MNQADIDLVAAIEMRLALKEARIAELEAAIRWAIGEAGDYGEYRIRGWWRNELRLRAKL